MKMRHTNSIIVILGIAVILMVLGFYFQYFLEGAVPTLDLDFVIHAIILVIMIAVLLSLILIQKLLFLAKQEGLLELQNYHIEQLQEMNRIIRTQRHDFVNHLQTVYGLMQLGMVEEAQVFMSEIFTEVQISGEVLRLAIPELSALLLVKMGLATSRNISFKIEVRSDLAKLRVRPLDLVSVTGNLINNALEAVEKLPAADRKVQIRIFENTGYFIVQTLNNGFIPQDLQRKIFASGFSTKNDRADRGLGLASVKHLADTHKGFVVVSSHPVRGTCFSVGFPKSRLKERFLEMK